MPLFKCKMCGGDLNVTEGMKIVECDFCGTTQTVPNADDEKKINLFNRANRLRIAGDFDHAIRIYESVIAEFPDETEAYWCVCLCKYGIEYVDDPKTAKKVPTCHRTSFESIFNDVNYQHAVSHADFIAKAVYESEAKAIDELQKNIISIVNKEKPFDVFICYKETDEYGNRTADSVLAQDIYDQLTSRGIKVFFARISLEDKLGQEYEPYIFAALNSAKVMLVVGTNSEYYNSVWVKNEWSRYLSFMNSDKNKVLIPCYRDIDPYDMPQEFKKFQGQDMSKLGFMQDLIRGVEKIARGSDAKVGSSTSAHVGALTRRGYLFLEDGNFKSADEYFDKALDENPEDPKAYVGKVLAILHKTSVEEINDIVIKIDDYKDFDRAIRFATGDEKTRLEEIRDYAERKYQSVQLAKEKEKEARKLRKEKERIETRYKYAIKTMNEADNEEQYRSAGQIFETILDYKDSSTLSRKCFDLADEERNRAKEELQKSVTLYNEYRKSLQKEKTIESEKAEANKRLSLLMDQHKKLTGLKNTWQEVENKLCSINNTIKSIQMEISCLVDQKSKLGIFAGKQKKAIVAKINALESEHQLLKDENAKTLQSLLGCNTIVDVENSLDQIEQQIDAANKNIAELSSIRSIKSILDEFSDLKMSKKLLQEYDDFKDIKPGKHITFGSYDYNEERCKGKMDIEWCVLDVKDGKALVISKHFIEEGYYEWWLSDDKRKTWDTCSLRRWLNDAFINSAFSIDEIDAISTVTVAADKNSSYATYPGKSTQDKIFLLSRDETIKYFKTLESRRCSYPKGYGPRDWWLRSPGKDLGTAAFVNWFGDIEYALLDFETKGIRPVMWIDLELYIKLYFWGNEWHSLNVKCAAATLR